MLLAWNPKRNYKYLKILLHCFLITIIIIIVFRRLFLQEDLTDPRNSSLFSRLAQSTNASVLIQPPSSRTGDDFLLAAKVSSKEQLLAVSGALVGKEAIQSVWNKVVGAFNISDSAHLYWLDEGGYVIATNQINAAVGSFIGHSDPQV